MEFPFRHIYNYPLNNNRGKTYTMVKYLLEDDLILFIDYLFIGIFSMMTYVTKTIFIVILTFFFFLHTSVFCIEVLNRIKHTICTVTLSDIEK